MDERLKKQLDFILEVDKSKFVVRQTYLTDGIRKEDDAEHSWHIALMAILLAEYSNEPVDVLRVVSMLLVHDLIEIDAGDTYAYDENAKKTQHEREKKAADRIYGLLPGEQGRKLYDLWEEFEAQETPEAKFARTMDNIQPMLLNDASGGISWKEHNVKLSQILGRNERTHLGSETIWKYAYNNILKKHIQKGNIIDDVNENL